MNSKTQWLVILFRQRKHKQPSNDSRLGVTQHIKKDQGRMLIGKGLTVLDPRNVLS